MPDRRSKTFDTIAGLLTVCLIVVSLWLVRCSSEPKAVYDNRPVIINATDSVADSLSVKKKNKTKTPRKHRQPQQRSFLDEPIEHK